MLCRITHMTKLPVVTCVMNAKDQACSSSVTCSCPFGDGSSKFVYSGLPIRAKYKHFKTICEHTSDISPTDASSSLLKWWSSKQGFETLHSCSVFCLPARSIIPRIFEHVLPCRKTTQPSLREALSTLVIFQLSQQRFRDSNISLHLL